MATYTFPLKAIPVRDFIRKHVPRPKELPSSIRRDNTALGFDLCCPVGLLPDAPSAAPASDFCRRMAIRQVCDEDGLRTFMNTWDAFTEPQKAVDAVWGDNEC